MALGDSVNGLSEIVSVLPVEVSDKVLDLVLIFKALSIVALLYIMYVVLMGIFNYRRMKKVADIEKKVESIEKKINSINRKLSKALKKKN